MDETAAPDVKCDPATSSSTPLLKRLHRGGMSDGFPRDRGVSTPCRSGDSPDASSPGVPSTTPPSVGRLANARPTRLPTASVQAAARSPRSLRPAAFTSGAESAFDRAASGTGTGRAAWDAMGEQRDASSISSMRRAAQLGGMSHCPSEPSLEESLRRQKESAPQAPRTDLSVRELKDLLASHGVDFSSCVEKSELQELLNKFEMLCQRPLEELHVSLAVAAAGSAVPPPKTVEACAALLLGKPVQRPQDTPAHSSAARAPSRAAGVATTPPHVQTPRLATWTPDMVTRPARAAPTTRPETESPNDSPAGNSVATASATRENEALAEIKRIESTRRGSFSNASAWGFAILAVQTRDIASVQRGYRGLMKKLHPDKVQNSAAASNALEKVKEAKDACERSLSRQFAPGSPRRLSLTVLCSQPGRRRYRLNWSPPVDNESAPVRRYIVAALDPAYGKALNIAVLEPDYCEEKRRFVSVEELGTYVLAEEELQKMPSLWRQNVATVQVASANESGQSSWAILQVPLSITTPVTNFQSPIVRSSREEERLFAEDLKKRSGADLRVWLDRQRKPQLVTFIKSMGWPEEGTKGDLVSRVVMLLEREKRAGAYAAR